MKHDPLPDQPLVTLTSFIETKSSQTLLEYLTGRFKYLSPREWEERIASGAVKVTSNPSESR